MLPRPTLRHLIREHGTKDDHEMPGFLTRVFGLGKIPGAQLQTHQTEGIELMDEGVSGSVTYRNFRAPRRRSNWRRTWFLGSVILTRSRLVANAFAQSIVNIPLDDPRLQQIYCWTDGNNELSLAFDVAVFHSDWSGTMEYRCTTTIALDLCRALLMRGAAEGPPRSQS